MNVGNRWLLLLALAAAAAAGALAASGARARGRAARHVESRRQIKEWENEGGNLAPASAAPLRP